VIDVGQRRLQGETGADEPLDHLLEVGTEIRSDPGADLHGVRVAWQQLEDDRTDEALKPVQPDRRRRRDHETGRHREPRGDEFAEVRSLTPSAVEVGGSKATQ
jgi:hypothetical protein